MLLPSRHACDGDTYGTAALLTQYRLDKCWEEQLVLALLCPRLCSSTQPSAKLWQRHFSVRSWSLHQGAFETMGYMVLAIAGVHAPF